MHPSGGVERTVKAFRPRGVFKSVNPCCCGKRPPPVALLLRALVGLVLLLISVKVPAQVTGKASATGQFESNSNVFDLNSGTPLPTGGDSHRGDTFFAYGAQFDLNYLWGKQQFFASAGTTEFDYQRFTQLDHEDYRLDAGMKWTLDQLLDGKIDIRRVRTMVPFYDLAGTVLSLQTEQRESAEAGIKVTSQWRIEGAAYTSKLDEPLPEEPSLSLTETSGKITVKYLGTSRFTGGWYVSYTSGSYEGDTGANPSYHEYGSGVQTTYASPRSTFDGQVGYARRISTSGANNTSGLTGQIKFKEQLTAKTNVAVIIGRAIQNYVLNAGSEIDTSAGVTAEWQASYKLAVTLGYTYTYRNYPGQGNDPIGSDRIDHQQYATLGVEYRPLRWLVIKPYGNLQRRNSDYIGGDFSSTVFGLYFTLRTPDRPLQ